MSSLILSASPWTNDNNNITDHTSNTNTTNKRIPNMITTFNKFSSNKDSDTEDKDSSSSNKIDMLNKMSAVSVDNDGNNLANFNPLPNPNINVKREEVSKISSSSDLLPTPPTQSKIFASYPITNGNNEYVANNSNNEYSDYYKSYDGVVRHMPPLKKGDELNDNRLLEKINYMIHLLEEQQNEKTNNVTEEFILYSFLGVFMICIVDTFSRAGKYIR